ncbi:hypothetical protein [Rouxiella sp. WC2420]|uniref:Uncharacterized protein n=1 Tax=Rouxiella sp. WC2420 TaxID=3234145 RepID=A0AB39VL16_9GAMM
MKSIDGNLITVDAWANSSSTTTTPTDGVGLTVDPFAKGWAGNFNLLIPDGTDYVTGTCVEFGVQNNGIEHPTALNALDIVALDAAYNGTSAVYAHGAGRATWIYGINSAGNEVNFVSNALTVTPFAGFAELSDANVGLRFGANNAFAGIVFAKNNNVTDISPSNLTRVINQKGIDVKKPELILQISESLQMPTLCPLGYVNSAGITITLPPLSDLPIAGYKYTFRLFKSGKYTFKAYNSETTVGGGSTYSVKTYLSNQTIEFQFDGTYWQVFGPYGDKQYDTIITLTASGNSPLAANVVYLNAAGLTATLPSFTTLPAAGYKQTFRLIQAGTFIFSPNNNDVSINAQTSLSVTTTESYKTVEIQSDGTQWLAFGPY